MFVIKHWFRVHFIWSHTRHNHEIAVTHSKKIWKILNEMVGVLFYLEIYNIHKKFMFIIMYTFQVLNCSFYISCHVRFMKMTPLTWLADKKILSQSKATLTIKWTNQGSSVFVGLYKTEFYNPESKSYEHETLCAYGFQGDKEYIICSYKYSTYFFI